MREHKREKGVGVRATTSSSGLLKYTVKGEVAMARVGAGGDKILDPESP